MTNKHEEREEAAVRKELADHEKRISALESEESEEASDVTAQPVTEIAQTTALANATIVEAESATKRGVVASVTSHVDPDDAAPAVSGYEIVVNEDGSFSGGAFTERLANLAPNTMYFVRAYIVDEGGYAYSPEVSFKTLAA